MSGMTVWPAVALVVPGPLRLGTTAATPRVRIPGLALELTITIPLLVNTPSRLVLKPTVFGTVVELGTFVFEALLVTSAFPLVITPAAAGDVARARNSRAIGTPSW